MMYPGWVFLHPLRWVLGGTFQSTNLCLSVWDSFLNYFTGDFLLSCLLFSGTPTSQMLEPKKLKEFQAQET